MILRLILGFLLFFIIFKLLRYVIKLFSTPNNSNSRSGFGSNINRNKNEERQIKPEDVIDAEFEELPDKNSEENSKKNN